MPIILLKDIIDLRQRKRDELEYYNIELKKLLGKMSLVQREINLTEKIIDMIERENIIDLRAALEEKRKTSNNPPTDEFIQ